MYVWSRPPLYKVSGPRLAGHYVDDVQLRDQKSTNCGFSKARCAAPPHLLVHRTQHSRSRQPSAARSVGSRSPASQDGIAITSAHQRSCTLPCTADGTTAERQCRHAKSQKKKKSVVVEPSNLDVLIAAATEVVPLPVSHPRKG
eukprot:3973846-Prymnesium_polylepis.2